MRRAVALSRRMWPAWLAVAMAGALAAAAPWIAPMRTAFLDRLGAVTTFRVTNGDDAGLGTLREAILAADRTDGRARIVVDVPRVEIRTPLPPIVNGHGLTLESGRETAVIDAGGSPGPLLDVAAPGAVILNVQIVAAEGEAILIRGSGARITRVKVERSGAAVWLAAGSDSLVVENSEFEANNIGVQVSASTRRVSIVGNRFRGHRTAAVWAVAADYRPDGTAGLNIHDNRFDDDGQALIVMNADSRIERNTLAGSRRNAMFVSGGTAIVRANRIRSGIGFAISAERMNRSVIADNELDHNCAGGILVRDARNTDIVSNRVYANGYGIVMVKGTETSPNTVADNLVIRQFEDGLYVIGGSPVVRSNRLLENRRAGIHVASLRTDPAQTIASEPHLTANVLSGNVRDTVHDEYQAIGAAPPVREVADCGWRVTEAARASQEPR